MYNFIYIYIYMKVKFTLEQAMRPEGETMYSSTLTLTSVLDGGGWSTPRPGRFTPGKTWYPLYRRLGGPRGQSGRVRKISPLPGFDPRTVQPVVSRYTEISRSCATLAVPIPTAVSAISTPHLTAISASSSLF